VTGLAAQLAYYFFLALFPALLFLLALASFFPLPNITDDVGRSLGPFVSPQVLDLIQEQMRRLADNENGGLLTFGVAGALWSSSAALVSIVGALNRAYDIDDRRTRGTGVSAAAILTLNHRREFVCTTTPTVMWTSSTTARVRSRPMRVDVDRPCPRIRS
jgi:membrane protein